ncbi:MAG: DUF302 domain-containing protein [Pseudomonadota bacterium]
MHKHLTALFATLLATLLAWLALPAFAQQAVPAYVPTLAPVLVATPGAGNPFLQYAPPPTFGFNPLVPVLSPMQAQAQAALAAGPYTMRRAITQQEKIQMMQMALPMMTGLLRMNMADSMNYFTRKYKAKKGLSFEDVRDSLFLRANQVNVKKVGENLMWMDFKAVLEDKDAPRIEVYSFCDIAVGRELLKISPEFVVFLPCRVVIMEDANKDIWVMMLDWSLDWVKGFEKQLGLSEALVKGAIDLNARMDDMMRAAANGDL